MAPRNIIPELDHQDSIPSQAAVIEAQYVTFNDSNATMDWWVVGMEPANSTMIIGTERPRATPA